MASGRPDFLFSEQLPPDLASLIFRFLSVDTLLRCREVCAGWKSFLDAEPAGLWADIDLSSTSGILAPRTPALLYAACARAGDRLRTLDISGWQLLDARDVVGALASAKKLLILRARGCTAEREREVSISSGFMKPELVSLLATTRPNLQELRVDTHDIHPADALAMLRRAEEYAPLRVHTLNIVGAIYPTQAELPIDVAAFHAAGRHHPTFDGLGIAMCDQLIGDEAKWDGVVEMVLELKLKAFHLAASAFHALTTDTMSILPGLTRMLEADHLKELGLEENKDEVISPSLLKGPALEPFLVALGASHLTSLTLGGSVVWEHLHGGQAVMGELRGHATLTHLTFKDISVLEGMGDRVETGMIVAALASLLRVKSALVSLSMDTLMETLGDVQPLFEALAASRLRSLSFKLSSPRRCAFIDANFVTEVVLPACSACASLRELEVDVEMPWRGDAESGRQREQAMQLRESLALVEELLEARREADCPL